MRSRIYEEALCVLICMLIAMAVAAAWSCVWGDSLEVIEAFAIRTATLVATLMIILCIRRRAEMRWLRKTFS